MTAKELAEKLDGRTYGEVITRAEAAEAAQSGLVVVYGASDDLMEFEGAIYDEAGVFDGGVVYVTQNNIYEAMECPVGARKIRANWCAPGFASWTYETDIPHETFNIYDDGDLYCVGIVFRAVDAEEPRVSSRRDNPKYPSGHVFTLTICPKCHEGYEAGYEHICMKKNSYSLEYED